MPFPRSRRKVAAAAMMAAAALGVGMSACTATGSATSVATPASTPSKPPSQRAAPATSQPSVKPVVVANVDGVSVTGEFEAAPTVTVSVAQPPRSTEVAVIGRGPGVALRAGDLAVVDDVGRTWRSATTFENTYVMGQPPDVFPIGTAKLALPGLVDALVGVPVGSRVLVVIPAKDGFAATASLPAGVERTDTAVLVFDIIGSYPPNAGPQGTAVSSGGGQLPTVSGPLDKQPVITIPTSPPPATLSVTTLVQGNGPPVSQGQLVIAQYVGEIWATGAVFDSSWQRRLPSPLPIGTGNLIPAWDTGLVGVKIGSRVLIVAPPASGYGASGAPRLGVTGTDTLVFVVDVLGAYNT